jgi:hypothetical protein
LTQGQLGEIGPRHGAGRGTELNPGVSEEGGAPRGSGAEGQSQREVGLASAREPGLRDSPGASWEGGTVPARAQGQLWAPISEELRDS